MNYELPETHLWLIRQLERYSPSSERLEEVRQLMRDTLLNTPDCFERTCVLAHFTASAWVLNERRDHVLLVYHRGLKRWLQPGGHADGQGNLLAVALRELGEETGVHTVRPWPGIFDLDAHEIPATEKMGAHTHLDVRFAFEIVGEQQLTCSEESIEVRWVKLIELERYDVDASVQRLALPFLGASEISLDDRCKMCHQGRVLILSRW
jgi:8-oxo-dGTP pyrophosphatase MutT (NUDIX family)